MIYHIVYTRVNKIWNTTYGMMLEYWLTLVYRALKKIDPALLKAIYTPRALQNELLPQPRTPHRIDI
jgi:hypothetical protein